MLLKSFLRSTSADRLSDADVVVRMKECCAILQSFHHKRPNRRMLGLRTEVILRLPRPRGESFLESLAAAEAALREDVTAEPPATTPVRRERQFRLDAQAEGLFYIFTFVNTRS
jgi:hypothetical protein